MASCMRYPGHRCPELYEVVNEGDVVASSGKKLEQWCYYCMATPRMKKVGHKASWTGRTPKWCPLGRDEEEES